MQLPAKAKALLHQAATVALNAFEQEPEPSAPKFPHSLQQLRGTARYAPHTPIGGPVPVFSRAFFDDYQAPHAACSIQEGGPWIIWRLCL